MISQGAKYRLTGTGIAGLLLVLSACSTQRTASDSPPGERAAAIAVTQIGVPYRYGGSDTRGFDCSGLVHYAYRRSGMTIPRTTADLWRHATPVPRAELRTGDILFFDIDGKVSHVGLYLGDGRFVHAPSSGKAVAVANLGSGYYRRAFVRGGRP